MFEYLTIHHDLKIRTVIIMDGKIITAFNRIRLFLRTTEAVNGNHSNVGPNIA